MNNTWLIIIVIGIFAISIGWGMLYNKPIYTINSFDELRKNMGNLDPQSLIIFDLDDTLVSTNDPWDRGYKKERIKDYTLSHLRLKGSTLNKQFDKKTRDELWAIYKSSREFIVPDPDVIATIQELQKRSIKVIALTCFSVGSVGDIASLEDLRRDQLKKYGFDFSSAFPNIPLITFKEFSFEDKHPTFKDGILYTTHACSKGALLDAFLTAVGWEPSNIIMFDNKKDNLISVDKHMKKRGIPFKGFYYIGAAQLPAYYDKTIAELQLNYLITHKKWLPGKQAQQKLMNEKEKL